MKRIRGFPKNEITHPVPLYTAYRVLRHKVEIYVPINNPEQEGVMKELMVRFSETFGGATMNPVLGGWVMEDGTLVTDKIGIVYSYVESVTFPMRKRLRKWAMMVAAELKEEAVTLVIDGGAVFITP